MQALVKFLRDEPAMVAAAVLAIANLFFSVTAEQALHLQAAVESVILLLVGGAVRSQVKPMAKIERGE